MSVPLSNEIRSKHLLRYLQQTAVWNPWCSGYAVDTEVDPSTGDDRHFQVLVSSILQSAGAGDVGVKGTLSRRDLPGDRTVRTSEGCWG